MKKQLKSKVVGKSMKAKAVVFTPEKISKLVMAPGGSLCPLEDLRNPNA